MAFHGLYIWDRSMWGHFGISFRCWDLQSNFKFVTLLVHFYLSAVVMLPLKLRSLITLRFTLFWSSTNPWQMLFFPCIWLFSLIHSHLFTPSKNRSSALQRMYYVFFLFCFLHSIDQGTNYFLFLFTISFFPPSILTSLSSPSLHSSSFTSIWKQLLILVCDFSLSLCTCVYLGRKK